MIDALSMHIRRLVLRRYGVYTPPARSRDAWARTIDSAIVIKGVGKRKVKDLINQYMIGPIRDAGNSPTLPDDAKRSALLFGPPGTGKTTFVKSVAQEIGWDFVPINPSVFLRRGINGVYVAANTLFSDLRDLTRAVVFFDEMDAMLQRRINQATGKQQLTFAQQFMTTSMLPHLADLYGGGRVLFFVATNHRDTFDAAIIRPGRLDMLLFIGPPAWRQKLDYVGQCVRIDGANEPIRADNAGYVRDALSAWVPEHDELRSALDMATVGEFRASSDRWSVNKASMRRFKANR